MENPLLKKTQLPLFKEILPEHVEPAIHQILSENRAKIQATLTQKNYSWDTFIQPLEEIDDHLSTSWATISHLHAVSDSEALRHAYNACLPKISEYSTELGQSTDLYNAIKSISESSDYHHFNDAQKKVIENELRDFRLAGVHLSPSAKKRYAELQQQLATLTSRFEENLLDATQGWTRLVTDENELSGLPSYAIGAAKEAAERKNLKGYLFTLDLPSYLAVITYAESRQLREEMYAAYVTRSSDQGPQANRWDNSEIMVKILTARKEIAQLLGYKNYAELSLVPKTANSTQEVLQFLNELAVASRKKAEEEFSELETFAKSENIDKLEAWDIAYYSEKLCQARYDISQEDLRPFFPIQQVLLGMFKIVHRLFGLKIREVDGVDVWHPDVKFFDIYDRDDRLRGQFYLDLYARDNKRSGAWMDECRVRRRLMDGQIQIPVAYLTCNFNAPVGSDPALLTHDDVITLFHEFGHGLHHLLTLVDYADVSGINGVPWDVVEFPSQFLENWCWEKNALDFIAKHYKTQESLPDSLFQKMQAARNFQSALQMMRQLEFALFDFKIHMEFDETHKHDQIQTFLDEIRSQVCVIPIPEFNRFQHSFSHIFSGGYAAGYYSYKWAEVLACDAFSLFKEKNILDKKAGASFLHNILEKGGSEDPIKLFESFRGRKPNIDALLKYSGIT